MRDENGRFVPGQSGNPKGRSPRRTEDEYLDAMISRVTLKDWREVVDKALSQAKRGDSLARQWLTNYIVGPPTQRLDVTSKGERITGYVAISPDDWDKGDDAT